MLESMGSQRFGYDLATEQQNIYLYMYTYICIYIHILDMASLIAQLVKNLPAMQEMRVQPLSQEDSLEKEMAAHSSVLAWRIPWTEEPGGLQSMWLQRVEHD